MDPGHPTRRITREAHGWRRLRLHTARLTLGVLCSLATSCAPESPPADVVLVGGPVVTLGEAGIVEGIAIRGDRIVAVGSETSVRARVGPHTQVIELDGRSVLPGLADNHLHSIGGGPGVDLSEARSLEEVLSAIRERAGVVPAGEVLVTNSDWHEGQLAEQRLPYRDDLDRAAPDHPVVVVRGGHEYILNSVALERWGIDASTPAVPGGRIGRYEDGRLNGELVDRAKDLVDLPPRPALDRTAEKEALEEQYRTLNRRGLTSVRHPGTSVEQYELIRELRDEGRLTVRVELLFRAPRGGSPEALREAMAAWPDAGGGEWLSVGGVKLGVDGGFEGGLMREPYEEPWGEGGRYHGLQTVDRGAFREVDRLTALRAATEGYAYLVFAEAERGTLDEGKQADLIVTAESYLDCPDPCLETMEVDLTMVDGRVVWAR